ncbi:MAG: PHP domain-containing protein [Chloroflexia bacterium]
MIDFAYLHAHTHYSSRGGPASPGEWVRYAAELGYKALGVADRAPLAALPSLLKAAPTAGVSPIIGVEVDIALPTGEGEKALQSAVLYASSHEGLANLARISELAYSRWPSAVRPVTLEALTGLSAGLVLVLGGSNAIENQVRDALDMGGWAREQKFVGAFVGLEHSGLSGDGERAGRIAVAAKVMELPVVAIPVARYPRLNGAPSCRALAIARKEAGWAVPAEEPEVDAEATPHQYLRPPGEGAALFEQWPEAVTNVGVIVEMCARTLNDGPGPLPVMDEGAWKASRARLRTGVEERLTKQFGESPTGPLQDRLEAELDQISRSSNRAAWPALARLVDIAEGGRIPLGAPLGAAAGSLVGAAVIGTLHSTPGADQASADESGEPTIQVSKLSIQYSTPPGVEVPGICQDRLAEGLAGEYGRVASAACVLDITPAAALRAARTVLASRNAGQLKPEMDQEPGAIASWEALTTAATGDQDGVESLALSLRGTPIMVKPDRDTLALAGAPGDAGQAGWVPMLAGDEVEGEPASPGWVPWTREELCEFDLPSLWIDSSPALSVLHRAVTLVSEYPAQQAGGDSPEAPGYTEWSDKAATLLKKGEIAGIPYLSGSVLKGWKGDLAPESLSPLVANSLQHPDRPVSQKAPPGEVGAWHAHTQDTGGALLYLDQFASVLEAAGTPPEEAAALRLEIVRSGSPTGASDPGNDQEPARVRFVEGCLRSDMGEEQAAALWEGLSAAAHGLVARETVGAWARVVARLASIKAAHPAAFLAAAIEVAWERQGPEGVRPLTEETRRLGVALLPPDAALSRTGPSLQEKEGGWAILWGLTLPGWSQGVAGRFVEAREHPGGLSKLGDLEHVCLEAGISEAQLEALVRSGACDHFGERDELLLWIKDRAWVPAPKRGSHPPSPRERYSRRAWEERNLGAGFTDASEMEGLRRALENSGGLRSRLVSTSGIGPSNVGGSVYLVGLLQSIRLVEDPAGATGGGQAQTMGTALVQDLDGEIELVAFPPNYKRHRELWVENNMVIITARVCGHTDGDGVYLLCEHLAAYQAGVEEEELDIKVKASRREATVPLPAPQAQPANGGSRQDYPIPQPSPQAAPQVGSQVKAVPQAPAPPVESPTYHLIITVPASDDDHADIDRMIALEKVLKARSGPDTVTLRIQYSPEAGDVTSAKLPHRVRYSTSLEEEIRNLLGPDALALIKLLG